LAAARQLKWFGYEVVVLEARGRVGGRVHSEVCGEEGREVDTGAMIITGIYANLNPKPKS
jgi:lysine-specific histone demethylase 1